MKRVTTIIAALLVCTAALADRPKVGVVFCGGGAKGAAHVGVLKVLEENGIPIDYIAGTSMGSIMGGLYAIGYSADELHDLRKVFTAEGERSGEISHSPQGCLFSRL